mgnify:CR=1 FL=1
MNNQINYLASKIPEVAQEIMSYKSGATERKADGNYYPRDWERKADGNYYPSHFERKADGDYYPSHYSRKGDGNYRP